MSVSGVRGDKGVGLGHFKRGSEWGWVTLKGGQRSPSKALETASYCQQGVKGD